MDDADLSVLVYVASGAVAALSIVLAMSVVAEMVGSVDVPAPRNGARDVSVSYEWATPSGATPSEIAEAREYQRFMSCVSGVLQKHRDADLTDDEYLEIERYCR